MKQASHTNSLITEKSPYLLQHAHNPVDWHPWGLEAFEKAKSSNKPIFLSIGYSTCYWCHVMEREVFENESIATLLNASFVCVKVDREERPDIDAIYMSALNALTGSGGWPMSLFLSPDLAPFYAATYVPPEQFTELVQRIHDVWRETPDKINEAGAKLLAALRNSASSHSSAPLGESAIQSCLSRYRSIYDKKFGGFGTAMKFPQAPLLSFLLDRHAQGDGDDCLRMVDKTVRAMADGGTHDHLAGGFHRYAVDRAWRVPHFEKMLYDQAQIAEISLDLFQITHDEFHATTARRTLDYVLGELADPRGGFHSAEDAESALDPRHPTKKQEGACYVWTLTQLHDTLGDHLDAELFAYVFGVDPDGNVPDDHDPHNVFSGKNILRIVHTIEEAAVHFGLVDALVEKSLTTSQKILLKSRRGRPAPHRDDKVLTSWNGLLISSLARASQILADTQYLDAANRCADFIITTLRNPQNGRLTHRYRDGDARIEGTLADYAFLVKGLIDLYEASFDIHRLQLAVELTEIQRGLFFDESCGGFFETADDDPTVPVRMKRADDNAEPSGNAIAILNLLRLHEMTGEPRWRDMAERSIECFSGKVAECPQAFPLLLTAQARRSTPPPRIVIAGIPGAADTTVLLREIHRMFLPGRTLVLVDGGEAQTFLASRRQDIKSMTPVEGKTAVYVCARVTCRPPVTTPAELRKLLS